MKAPTGATLALVALALMGIALAFSRRNLGMSFGLCVLALMFLLVAAAERLQLW